MIRKLDIPSLPPGWRVEVEGLEACVRDQHNRPAVRTTLPAPDLGPRSVLLLLWMELCEAHQH